jgi:diguanylate cyclase (GGDEF)-like protein
MKKVAVIMESWMRCFTYAWPSGMLTRIKEDDEDVSLYIFNCSANWSSDEAYNRGEYNIFRLPDFKDFDGIVLDLNNTNDENVRVSIFEAVKQSGVPAVVIGNYYEGLHSVAIDNYSAMHSIIEHLYEEHNSRKFWFIMGPEDNYESNMRTKAIKDFIKEKNIPACDYDFYYESFDHKCGRNGYHLFMKYCRELPDAIVCANDNIAVGCLEEAAKDGFKAPDDFLITGFDDLDKSRFYNPRISTMSYIREDIGYYSMDYFLKHWRGEEQDEVTYTKTTPIFWDSCGCKSDITIDLKNHLKGNIVYNIEVTDFEAQVLELKYALSHCTSVQEMLDCIPKCIPSLHCDAMYLVMDKHLDADLELNKNKVKDVVYDIYDDPFVEIGYPKDMTMAFSYENKNIVSTRKAYDRLDKIFPAFDCDEKGANFLFIPIHFKEKSVGYFVIRNAIYLMEKQFLFEIINSLMNALENLYNQEKLSRMNYALSVLYNHDALTMLHNRMGLDRGARLIDRCHAEGRKAFVMYIDLDRLKYINDTFGHEYGDIAIKAVADVIRKYASQNKSERMAYRLGGDEFLLVNCCDNPDKLPKLVADMKKDLKAIGTTKNFPVSLSMSVGYIITDPNRPKALDKYIKEADDIMYKDKVSRRMNRTE